MALLASLAALIAFAEADACASPASRSAVEESVRSVGEGAVRDLEAVRPSPGTFRLLLAGQTRTGNAGTLRLIEGALGRLLEGSLRDHVGGGFHRGNGEGERPGSRKFEKLIDQNALVLRAFVQGEAVTGSLSYRQVAEETVAWAIREMRDSSGAFWHALGATASGSDPGAYYTWSPNEILKALGPERGAEFFRTYRLGPTGELVLAGSPFAGLGASRQVLLGRRMRRVRPPTDERLVAGSNGLMVGALALSGRQLRRGSDVEAARRAAQAVLDRLGPPARLRHQVQAGRAEGSARLDDYAYLAEGLLELHDASGEERWLLAARELADVAVSRLWDVPSGGFLDREAVAGRPAKTARDGDLPAPNGVMAGVLFRLYRLSGEERYAELGCRTIASFLSELKAEPRGMETLAEAAAHWPKAGGR